MPRPRSDIDDRIVVAARERFLTDGVDGASLRAIAEDARTSVGMIYYYFPTKDDLFLASVEEVYRALVADLERSLAPGPGMEVRLERLFRRFACLTEEEFTVLRLVLREAMVSSERRAKLIQLVAGGHFPLIMHTMAEGISEGAVSKDFPLAVLVMGTFAMAVVPQVIRRLLGDSSSLPIVLPEREEFARQMSRLLMQGLGPRLAPRDEAPVAATALRAKRRRAPTKNE